ncbi:la protein homolog [Macrosteles quadrilineatus]|uniref:la protein homolog n=1 Tax=Macrosteles quadrilineatus TaxID=74068 RepID=UPI0023E25095|nr:la protein homolog [Macrosteles quadrilineatus]
MANVNGSTNPDSQNNEETKVNEEVNENGSDTNKEGTPAKESAADVKAEVILNPELRAKKIKRQIEYYFGDFNLPSDKFLREEVKQKDGWVALETMLKFKRLASLTQDPAVIVEALTGSELVQISEDKTEVRRNPDKPLPEESEARRKEILERTVYVKGFPEEGFTIDNALDYFEAPKQNNERRCDIVADTKRRETRACGHIYGVITTIAPWPRLLDRRSHRDRLRTHFEVFTGRCRHVGTILLWGFEEFGPTDDVVLRFWQDKATKTWKFKGSVFVKFPSREAASAFLAREDVKYGDEVLIKMFQEEYIEQKRKERLELKEQKMLKRKRPESEMEDKADEKGLPKNATLHMTKIPEGLVRETVKEQLEGLGISVAFIDYNKGDSEGWIRLFEEGSAEKVMKECEDGILKLKDGQEVTLKPLEGEEEEKFLESARKSILDRRSKHNKPGRGRRGGGRGRGRGGWGRGRRHDSSGEPQAKGVKTTFDDDD